MKDESERLPAFEYVGDQDVPVWLFVDKEGLYYWFTRVSKPSYQGYRAFYTYAYRSATTVIEGMVYQDKSLGWNGSNSTALAEALFHKRFVTSYAPLILTRVSGGGWYFILDFSTTDGETKVFAESTTYDNVDDAIKDLCHSDITWRDPPDFIIEMETISIED